MLLDRFQRRIDYLRISVTNDCNLRCRYCIPADEVMAGPRGDLLSLAEIADVAAYAVSRGMRKIRLTGGEPLRRAGIVELVAAIGRLPGLSDFGMTTNGQLLAEHARALKEARLHRVNVSLDSLDPGKYAWITRGGELSRVLAGLDAAKRAGLAPIKINVVITRGWNDGERAAFEAFGRESGYDVRFIPRMHLQSGHRGGTECDSAFADCSRCNRLRLTCDGRLKPCLFSEEEIDLRAEGLARAFDLALERKPASGGKNGKELMYQIGG